ncbi:MAG: hypothetical protein D6675_04260 [Gemmatimonadetes bacterium]|nr:MAG: hypothetical protein D6675_04260 [Gemmatimonadota bacterium]
MIFKRTILFVAVMALTLFIWLSGCTDKYPTEEEKQDQVAMSSCTTCHLNETVLKEFVGSDLVPPPGSGEG